MSETIGYGHVARMNVTTHQIVMTQFMTMGSHLRHIITKWEASGQGNGGIDPKDDDSCPLYEMAEFGKFDHHTHGAMDSRASFLNGRHLYLLYLWHQIE